MDNTEATAVLISEMLCYRAMSYAELVLLLDQLKHIETEGASGTRYQVDVEVMWDDKPEGDLRVIGAVDDGGWRAYSPLTDSFILRADGTFVGE